MIKNHVCVHKCAINRTAVPTFSILFASITIKNDRKIHKNKKVAHFSHQILN